jgi:hypothetical protein
MQTFLGRYRHAIRGAGRFGHEWVDAIGEAQAQTREVLTPMLAHVPGLLGGRDSLRAAW